MISELSPGPSTRRTHRRLGHRGPPGSRLPRPGHRHRRRRRGGQGAHTAEGTARFLPALYAASASEDTFTAGSVSATAAPGSPVALQVADPGGRDAPVAMDVMFLLDATGLMGDEIDRLKTTIDSVAAQVAGFDSQPDVRFAMTFVFATKATASSPPPSISPVTSKRSAPH